MITITLHYEEMSIGQLSEVLNFLMLFGFSKEATEVSEFYVEKCEMEELNNMNLKSIHSDQKQ